MPPPLPIGVRFREEKPGRLVIFPRGRITIQRALRTVGRHVGHDVVGVVCVCDGIRPAALVGLVAASISTGFHILLTEESKTRIIPKKTP